MSAQLREFLQWWLNQAESDNPCGSAKWYGLCYNLIKYSNGNEELCSELSHLLGSDYPFGQDDYDTRQMNDTMHKCPKRLAWVREQLAKE